MNAIKKNSPLMFLFAAAGILVLAVLAWQWASKRATHAESLTPVTIGIQDNIFSALVLIAKDKDYFADSGLDVSLKKYPTGKIALDELFQRNVQIATASGPAIVAASFERRDFAIFCTIGYSDRAFTIVARKDHGIHKPSDLRGKKIATLQYSSSHFFLDYFLRSHGVKTSQVKHIFADPDAMVQDLVDGTVDAISMRSPYANRAAAQLGNLAITFRDPSIYRHYFNLIALKSYIKTRRDVPERIISALQEAEKLVMTDKSSAIATVIAELGADRADEIRSDWPNYHLRLSLSQSLLVNLDSEVQWYRDQRPDLTGTNPNYLDYIYLEAMQDAAPSALTILR